VTAAGTRPSSFRFPKEELPPGARKLVHAGRREVAVFNVDGTYYAIFNRCPHHQAPLHLGPIGGTSLPSQQPGVREYGLEGRVLRCPWHHYEYDLATGRCLADPDHLRVRTYDVREDGDDLVVELGAAQ
jgi:3-phenylpropionate/trans-cinnamate dioxygenase ferredoxin subunit